MVKENSTGQEALQTTTDILIVEDDIVAATLLKKTLVDLGHSVVGVAMEGRHAIQMAREKQPQLMMVDYQLEDDLNGADVTRKVMEEQSVAVIYVTSKSDKETLDSIAQTNPDGYILKPFNRKEIGMVINTVLEKFNQQRILNSLNTELGLKVEMTNEELKKSLDKLQIEVELRKEAEVRLKEALKREKEFSDIKSRLAASISHEFKTPLTSILSSTQILQMRNEGSANEEANNKHLMRIEESTIHLKKILSNILYIENSGLEDAGNSETIIELKDFVETVISEVSNEFAESSPVTLNIHNAPETISTYAELLKQILINLTSNAIKYSPKSSPVAVNVTGKRDELIFEFIDQGIGIPKEDHKHLFQYFFRAKNTSTIGGNGLGLAITKNFATIINADLTFVSEQNKGTTFTLRLPIRDRKTRKSKK
jgi:signal transduction histidine kinase